MAPAEGVPQLSGIAALDAYDVCDLDFGLSSGMGETKDALEKKEEAPRLADGGGPRLMLLLGSATGPCAGKGKSGIEPTDDNVDGRDNETGVSGAKKLSCPEYSDPGGPL